MLNILLAIPAVWWGLLFVALYLSWKIKGNARIKSFPLLLWVAGSAIIVALNPISTVYNDERVVNYVEVYEEPVTSEIVDRTLKPRLNYVEREQRNKELFNAMDQANEILKGDNYE